jgi:hypothetical protein
MANIFKAPTASQFRGRFGVSNRDYKRYVHEGPRTSVGEWSDREPGYGQSVDMRYEETQKGTQPFIGEDENRATDRIKNLTRRSAVTAASRYQWGMGRSSGEQFGRRRAAQYQRYEDASNNPQKVEEVAQF